MINNLNKKGTIAITQIFILVLGIVAIGYALGSEVREVQAAVYNIVWNSVTNSFIETNTLKTVSSDLVKQYPDSFKILSSTSTVGKEALTNWNNAYNIAVDTTSTTTDTATKTIGTTTSTVTDTNTEFGIADVSGSYETLANTESITKATEAVTSSSTTKIFQDGIMSLNSDSNTYTFINTKTGAVTYGTLSTEQAKTLTNSLGSDKTLSQVLSGSSTTTTGTTTYGPRISNLPVSEQTTLIAKGDTKLEGSSVWGKDTVTTYASGSVSSGTRLTSGSINVNGVTKDISTAITEHGAESVKVVGNSKDGWSLEYLDSEGKVVGTENLGSNQPTIGAEGAKYTVEGSWYASGTLVGGLGRGIMWAAAVYGIVAIVDALAPDSWQPYTDALTYALPAGVLVGGTLYNWFSKGGMLEWGSSSKFAGITGGQWGAIGIGVAVAAVVFILMYEDNEEELVTFTCSPWQAPTGGSNCERCNDLALPCSEYQCKALGQGCELQNADTSTPICTWVNRYDVTAPAITLWGDVLTTGLEYSPYTAKSPLDKGTKIVSAETSSQCLPAYTALTFGIKTDEPAICKLDTTSKQNYSEMSYYFGSSLFAYNHSYSLSLPSLSSEGNENATLKNDGEMQLYVRCQDANGNYNVGNFIFKFCVDDSEDLTAPEILGTNLVSDMPIAYNTTNLSIELYTNEPAECRWDTLDQEWDKLDNKMSCSSNSKERNADLVYTCSGTLTGIKSGTGVENKYFFRCKDQPGSASTRNVNQEGYEFIILGTEPLILNDVGPNGTIKDNTDPVTVTLTAETSAGYKDGEATCYYSLTGQNKNYIEFFDTGAATSSQDLELSQGNYNISIKCVDLGGNSRVAMTNFTVESDSEAPEVTRIYKDGTNLRLETNEYAECVYSVDDCNYQFTDGISMTTIEEKNQYTTWVADQDYYIKCRDEYGNQPDAATCTIELRPFSGL